MKIAIASEGPTMDSMVAERFGRCPFFLILDQDGNLEESMSNDATQAAHGAGGMAVQSIAAKGAKTLIAPRLGPNATMALKASGIRAFEASGCTCLEALEKFRKGSLKEIPLG
ncbi:MAG TPA: NifB/NifX family molybdenum-iron cluster-binding protein [Thermovirgaceae bacterium]|nr:NifB/NifX family molybdenum-iron cluster-binding protein [Thermovirgaceae bacterium]